MGNRKYTCNQNFFSEPNIINSYWAGFIAADGYIYNKNNIMKLNINLKQTDWFHLMKMISAMDGNYPIRYYNKQCHLNIIGYRDIIIDLERNFSIVQKKSLILQPPKISEESYIKSYIRGYFDGDGCLSKISKYNVWQVNITSGSLDLLIWMQNMIEYFLPNIYCNIYYQNKCNNLIFSTRQALRFLKWLYNDSTAEMRLDRKYDLFLFLRNQCEKIDKRIFSSKYPGVSYDKSRNKWMARFKYKGHIYNIGRFKTEREAALAYNLKVQGMGLYYKCYEVE